MEVDVLILGAGVIGSSIASALSQSSSMKIAVLDIDLEGGWSSSELNAGGVRATWNLPLNVEMSVETIRYFQKNPADFGYRPVGYLWLKNETQWKQTEKAQIIWKEHGWDFEEWTTKKLAEKHPFFDRLDGVSGALFAPHDGLVNPNLVKNHFRQEAESRGVLFINRHYVESVSPAPGSIWTVTTRKLPQVLSGEDLKKIFQNQWSDFSVFEKAPWKACHVINAAGPWASQIAQKMSAPVPVRSQRRQISLFDCPPLRDRAEFGMVVLDQGVYFHPESSFILSGYADPQDQNEYDFSYGGEDFFNEKIWAPLIERSSAFDAIRHITGWAGLYEVSPDECAVMGPVGEDQRGLWECHSFSGHGVMHSYSAGKTMAEWIVAGSPNNTERKKLTRNRFQTGELLHEGAVI